jgi:zinc transport system substrate-binding protein
MAACSDPETQPGASDAPRTVPQVFVVNYPLQFFAERIGGDAVGVEFPAPGNEDPAFWMPDPETVTRYQQADLILLNGAGYAAWITSAALPLSTMVDTSRNFADRLISVEDAVTHSHGPEGEHSHGSTAFTTWLDPTLALEQARAVTAALTRRMPEQEQVFRDRYQELESDLLRIDRDMAAAVATDPTRPLLGSHPVYQYLARKYDLNLHSVHWEPDEVPDEEEWTKLESLLTDHPANWMLWESEPLTGTADRLRGLGVETVVFDPCGRVPDQGDFLGVMLQNLQNLRRAFR